MRNALRFLMILVVRCATWTGVWWVFSRLSTPCQVLLFLAAVLFDLIRTTGRGYTPLLTTAGPATLAGPIHPWQQKEAHLG